MSPENQIVLFVALVWLFVLALFALPSLLALRRGDPNRWLILAINASVVSWAVALIMALYPLFRLGGPTGPDNGELGRAGARPVASAAGGLAGACWGDVNGRAPVSRLRARGS